MLHALGSFVHQHPRRILVVAGLFLALSIGLVLAGGRLTGGAIAGLESEIAERRVEQVIDGAPDTTVVVVFSYAGYPGDRAAALAAIEHAVQPLRDDPRVRSVVTPLGAPPMLGRRMIDEDQHAAYVRVALAGTFKDAVAAYPSVRRALSIDGMTVVATGRVVFQHDLDAMLERDLLRAEAIALPISILVLLLVFRTLVAAILPVAVGALAVLGGVGIVLALSHVIDIASYTINIVSLIGLGVAIDYSLFMVSRYREELAAGRDYRAALVRTMQTTGRVVAFSGLAVGTGLTGLLFFEGSYLLSLGIGGAIVVGLAMVFALTFLPALLAVLGPRIHVGRIRLRHRGGERHRSIWERSAWVLDHPWRVLVPTTLLLLVMGIPFFHMRLAGVDANVLERDAEARRGQALLARSFPDLARNRIVVAVEFPTEPALTPERILALYDLAERLSTIEGVAKVESLVDPTQPVPREAYPQLLLAPSALHAGQLEAAKAALVRGRVVLLYALTDLSPESEGARRIVHDIRLRRQVADGALVVGGQTALDLDSTSFIVERTPRAIGFVVGVTLIVLYLTFGSVVLPLKAVLMNFLSIAASFGAMVWVFQEGHLFVDVPRPIDPSVPILLFCVLFGLSMDYHVLMLSRIREAYEDHGDNRRAVADGLAHSAGLITSAAAIMITVFGAFALARFVVIRSVGFGMAVAVALDATLVRVLLVPASMRLLGKWNWWSPRWLSRLRAHPRR
jgi:RND superfamily putative drug exporter